MKRDKGLTHSTMKAKIAAGALAAKQLRGPKAPFKSPEDHAGKTSKGKKKLKGHEAKKDAADAIQEEDGHKDTAETRTVSEVETEVLDESSTEGLTAPRTFDEELGARLGVQRQELTEELFGEEHAVETEREPFEIPGCSVRRSALDGKRSDRLDHVGDVPTPEDLLIAREEGDTPAEHDRQEEIAELYMESVAEELADEDPIHQGSNGVPPTGARMRRAAPVSDEYAGDKEAAEGDRSIDVLSATSDSPVEEELRLRRLEYEPSDIEDDD